MSGTQEFNIQTYIFLLGSKNIIRNPELQICNLHKLICKSAYLQMHLQMRLQILEYKILHPFNRKIKNSLNSSTIFFANAFANMLICKSAYVNDRFVIPDSVWCSSTPTKLFNKQFTFLIKSVPDLVNSMMMIMC